MLALYLFPVLLIQYPTPIIKTKVNIKLIYRHFGYIGFDNIKKIKKIVISLEFDNAYNVTKLTRLCDLYKKGRFIREVNKKP